MTFAESAALLEGQTEAWDHALDAGRIILDGVPYECAVIVGRIRPQFNERTLLNESVQDLTIALPKALRPSAPDDRSRLVHDSNDYTIRAIGGQSPTDLAWVLNARRTVTK